MRATRLKISDVSTRGVLVGFGILLRVIEPHSTGVCAWLLRRLDGFLREGTTFRGAPVLDYLHAADTEPNGVSVVWEELEAIAHQFTLYDIHLIGVGAGEHPVPLIEVEMVDSGYWLVTTTQDGLVQALRSTFARVSASDVELC
jgi:hypothetical protein